MPIQSAGPLITDYRLPITDSLFTPSPPARNVLRLPRQKRPYVLNRYAHQPRTGGVVVVAEGVRKLFVERKVKMMGKDVDNDRFVQQVATFLQKDYLSDSRRRKVTTFINRPRHQIRAIAPNAFDRTYCERLGAMAVESGLAGYTGCMVSNWLNEYVLVPLSLACAKRSLALGGLFWKQVVMSTGQPDISPPPLDA